MDERESNSEINQGYDPAVIAEFKAKLGTSRFITEGDGENSDEYAHFRFVGEYKGVEVIYDAALYTLRLNHESEVYEIAEQRASKQFPDFKKLTFEEEDQSSATVGELAGEREEEIGLFMAEVIMELEEEESVKVKEHVEIDDEAEFGVSLDVGLQLEKITPDVIEKFIREFNSGTLKLDDTLFSFQTRDDGD